MFVSKKIPKFVIINLFGANRQPIDVVQDALVVRVIRRSISLILSIL